MRSSLLCAALLAASLQSVSAHAHGYGAGDALSYTWTGFFGGVNAGWGYQTSDWDFGTGGSASTSDNSGVVGLQAGYDYQLGSNLFAGLEASIDASNLDGKSLCHGGDTCESKLSSFGDISARLGVAQGRALFYLKGGVAYEDETHHLYVNGVRYHDNGGANIGYLLGAGAEYALTYNITTKLEYNYMGFGSNDSLVAPGTSISSSEPINVVKLGFNFKFE